MEFFDKLSKTITDGSEKVVKKAKEVSNIASLKASIEKAKLTNEKIYSKIGKDFFEEHKEEVLAKYPDDGNKLVENLANIDKWTDELLATKNVKVCPVCHKEVDVEEVYCHFCGSKFPEPVVEETEDDCNCEWDESKDTSCCAPEDTSCCCNPETEENNTPQDNCF